MPEDFVFTLASTKADPDVDEPVCVVRVTGAVARRLLGIVARSVGAADRARSSAHPLRPVAPPK